MPTLSAGLGSSKASSFFARTQSRSRFMSSNLRQRAVVSSFICTSPQSATGFTFALFKRSPTLSTYPGKWAVCSGSIETTDANPEAAAKREILEETTLDDKDITLLRRGKSFSLVDEKLKTRWTIHPFAWQLKKNAKPIKFDWEHTEYNFIKPKELVNYDHVPQLEIGLERIIVSPEVEEALEILAYDHVSGAQALAIKALELILKSLRVGELSKLTTTEDFWRGLRWWAWHLAKNGRPSMGAAIEASIFKSLQSAKELLEATSAGGINSVKLGTAIEISETAIKERIVTMKHRLDTLAGHFVQFVEDDIKTFDSKEKTGSTNNIINIVTLSASNTISTALQALLLALSKKGQKIQLTVLESRPKFEGVSFAQNILDACEGTTVSSYLEVNVVSDASIASVIKDAHYLLLGADKVLPSGDISNKIGSFPAAVVARSLNPTCKIIVLHETEKIVSSDTGSDHLKREDNDENEITDSWPKSYNINTSRERGWNIRVTNEYFEWVPEKFIDEHISEEGILSVADIEKLSHQAQELEVSLCADL